VAQYSRPAFKDEGYQEQDQLDLTNAMPTAIDLKFALPPVAQVSRNLITLLKLATNDLTGAIMAPRNDRRPLEPQLPHQARSRNNYSGFQVQGRHHRGNRFESNCRKLDCQSNSQEGHRDQPSAAGYHGWWCCRLSVLARLPRYAVPPSRAPSQAPYLSRRRLQDPGQPGLPIQGHGLEHGMLPLDSIMPDKNADLI
jgi:hypothetical protein